MQRMTIAPMTNYISRVKTWSNETLCFHTHTKKTKIKPKLLYIYIRESCHRALRVRAFLNY